MMPDDIHQVILIFRANGPETAGYWRMPGNRPYTAAFAGPDAAHGWLTPGAGSAIWGWPGVYRHSRSVSRELVGDATRTQNA